MYKDGIKTCWIKFIIYTIVFFSLGKRFLNSDQKENSFMGTCKSKALLVCLVMAVSCRAGCAVHLSLRTDR